MRLRGARRLFSSRSLDNGAIPVLSNGLYEQATIITATVFTLPEVIKPLDVRLRTRPVLYALSLRSHSPKHPRNRLRADPVGSQQSGSTRCHLCLSCTCACGDDQGVIRQNSRTRVQGPCTRSGCFSNPDCRHGLHPGVIFVHP